MLTCSRHACECLRLSKPGWQEQTGSQYRAMRICRCERCTGALRASHLLLDNHAEDLDHVEVLLVLVAPRLRLYARNLKGVVPARQHTCTARLSPLSTAYRSILHITCWVAQPSPYSKSLSICDTAVQDIVRGLPSVTVLPLSAYSIGLMSPNHADFLQKPHARDYTTLISGCADSHYRLCG